MSKSQNIAFIGIFTALAIVAGYIERIIPSPVPVPGVKLGIANIIIILCLYMRGGRMALAINFTRIIVSGLLFSGLSGIIYALVGGALSFISMYTGKRIKVFGLIGVSILGGVSHNMGQIFLAAIVVWNIKLLYYMPVLIISGVITGAAIGLTAWYTLGRL